MHGVFQVFDSLCGLGLSGGGRRRWSIILVTAVTRDKLSGARLVSRFPFRPGHRFLSCARPLLRFRSARFIGSGGSLLVFRLGRRLLPLCVALFVSVAQVGPEFLICDSAPEPRSSDRNRSCNFHRSLSGRQVPWTFFQRIFIGQRERATGRRTFAGHGCYYS